MAIGYLQVNPDQLITNPDQDRDLRPHRSHSPQIRLMDEITEDDLNSVQEKLIDARCEKFFAEFWDRHDEVVYWEGEIAKLEGVLETLKEAKTCQEIS